ncbi:MAG: hypothetical protein JNM25_12805 [Planctomycetes bacterium]|nr:hypothetical protein [Planctomycetota bacterium]
MRGTWLLSALAGGLSIAAPCQSAAHIAYGAGCHDLATESFGVLFADAAAAAATLSGHSLVLVPEGTGYRVTWNGATYRAPSAAAVALPPSDDGQVALPLASPLPTPQGALSALYVHSNGFVAAGPDNDGGAWNVPATDYLPTPCYRNAPATAFFAWHDWNPAEPGSGRIVHEEVVLGGERTLCITWNDVENFPTGQQNRGTFQFQFGLATGRVAYVWVHVDATTSSVFGTAHLIGYSPGGVSLDAGLRTLPQDLPLVTAPDQFALALRAAPPPVSTPAAGTVVTYTTEHVPPREAGSDLRLGVTALSIGDAPGVDLGPLGMPGCQAWVRSLDLQLPWSGTAATIAAAVTFPPGLPAGASVFAQSLALVDRVAPGALGIWTSNGVQSRIAPD